MALLIIAIVISSISVYGVIVLKRFYFMLGYFLFSLLAITSFMPLLTEDPMLSITSLALFIVSGIISFPAKKNIFRALEKCPWDDIKVVILGQDPYHGEGQAQGLSFSVPAGAKFPPSLRNIFKELSSDLVIQVPFQG